MAARLAEEAPMPAQRWASRAVEWQGAGLLLGREERLGAPAITVYVADDAAGLVFQLPSGGADFAEPTVAAQADPAL